MFFSLQNPLFWTWKQLFAILVILATSNICPLAITEFFAHNMGIRLLANHSLPHISGVHTITYKAFLKLL